MQRSSGLLTGSVMLLAAAVTGAAAQGIGNETWLGQVGGTNTIAIDQTGRNNQAGADNVSLRLNQNGDNNLLTISQFGHRNQVGAAPFEVPPTGINQIGSSNEISIVQQTARDAFEGSNIVGAVFQRSADLLLRPTNILSIFQGEIGIFQDRHGGNGEAGHVVGVVRQIHTGADQAANRASISQTGGGLDSGNVLGALHQEGTANEFRLTQDNQSNEVRDARQIGHDNRASVEQGLFAGFAGGNLVEYLHQFGFRNISQIVMLGSNNVIQRIFQDNGLLGASAVGNMVNVTLDSEENGSTGNGRTGDFLSLAARDVSAAQSNVEQIGDHNRASITITGADNRFGTRQHGDDNDVIISIAELHGQSARNNESAVFQKGTGNSLTHFVLGKDNVGAVRQFGDMNKLSIEQRGNGNLAEAVISGNSNNLAAAFSGLAAVPGLDLRPGQLYQKGLGNTILSDTAGNNNNFAFHQDGGWNVAESMIIGNGNQVVMAQIGNGNVAITRQVGNGNVAVIRQ